MEPSNDTRNLPVNNVGDIALTPEMVTRVLEAMMVAQDGEPDRLATEHTIESGGLSLIAHDIAFRVVESVGDVRTLADVTRGFAHSLGAERSFWTMVELERCDAIVRIARAREHTEDIAEVLTEASEELDKVARKADDDANVALVCVAAAELAVLRAELDVFVADADKPEALAYKIGERAGYSAELVTLAVFGHIGWEHARRYVAALESAAAGIYASRKAAA